MSGDQRFDASEWQLLADTPLAAAAAVALASEGGGRREAGAITAGWRVAAERFNTPLLRELGAGMDPEHRAEREGDERPVVPGDEHAIVDEAIELCTRAIELLEEKATPQEQDDYKAFVVGLTLRVADADNEGGFLGFGGDSTSHQERVVIRAIASALQYNG